MSLRSWRLGLQSNWCYCRHRHRWLPCTSTGDSANNYATLSVTLSISGLKIFIHSNSIAMIMTTKPNPAVLSRSRKWKTLNIFKSLSINSCLNLKLLQINCLQYSLSLLRVWTYLNVIALRWIGHAGRWDMALRQHSWPAWQSALEVRFPNWPSLASACANTKSQDDPRCQDVPSMSYRLTQSIQSLFWCCTWLLVGVQWYKRHCVNILV